jgi:putative heme-binding domain-containing protein
VRYQLAFTLGDVRHPQRIPALAALVARDASERWMRVAVLSSLADGAGEMLALAVDGGDRHAADPAYLEDLLRVIGARNKGTELLAALEFLAGRRDPAAAFPLLAGFADGLQRAGVPLALFQPRLQPILDRAERTARDSRADDETRVRAIELLGAAAPGTGTRALLLSLVDPSAAWILQRTALAALARIDDPSLPGELVRRWPRFTPALKREALSVLLARPERALALVDAIGRGAIRPNELTPTQIAGLRAHRSPDVRSAASRVLTLDAPGDRQAVVRRYAPSLELAARSDRGRLTYQARCAACHEPNRDGWSLGPAAATMRSLSREQLLTAVLDPGRTVDARYQLQLVETRDGRSFTGIVDSETDSSVTLRQPGGAATLLVRSGIARMEGMSQSMMPEGLEEGLSVQDMADLLEFLVAGAGSP